MHYEPGYAFIWTCRVCDNEQREDVEEETHGCFGRCVRRYYSCNNVDCREGPVGRYLRDVLNRDRCGICKGLGVVEIDGDEAPCPDDDCLAANLLMREFIAERIYSPGFHREELGITHTLPGRVGARGENMVVNRHHGNVPAGAVYVGRGSLWGNPFSHKKGTRAAAIVDSREDAIEAYRLWLTTDLEIVGWPKPTREQVTGLRGGTLVCYCAPKPCHGDVLLELAELWSA